MRMPSATDRRYHVVQVPGVSQKLSERAVHANVPLKRRNGIRYLSESRTIDLVNVFDSRRHITKSSSVSIGVLDELNESPSRLLKRNQGGDIDRFVRRRNTIEDRDDVAKIPERRHRATSDR